jgi:Tfp pilus assembly protein PilN
MSNPFRPVAPVSSSFLPEDYVARKTETRVNILILAMFALVLGGVVAAFVVTNRHWRGVRARQLIVNDQWSAEGKKMDQLKELQGQRAQMMEKAEITAALIERVPRWAVLGEIALRMPADMRLDSLIIKSTRVAAVVAPPATGPGAAPIVKSLTDKIKGTTPPPAKPKAVQVPKFTYALTITGSTAKNTDVADFLAALKASPVLKSVELTFIKESKEKDRELRKFEILAQVTSETDTTLLAASLQKLIAERTALLDGKNKDGVQQASPEGVPVTPVGVDKGGN